MRKLLLTFKIFLMIIYFGGTICLWEIIKAFNYIPYIHTILPVYLLIGGVVVAILWRYPYGKGNVEAGLRSIGFVNYLGETPKLMRRNWDTDNPCVAIFEFKNPGIPLAVWEEKQPSIEAGLNKTILKMKYHRGKRRVQVYTLPATNDMPTRLLWEDKYLPDEEFVLILGESFLGPVTINLSHIPHILIGGSTGSGKSVLLKLLLMQALHKGAEIYIADFKGGVDFSPVWHRKCQMCFEPHSLLELLAGLVEELERRRALFREVGCPNIDEYNKVTEVGFQRYIFACDEVAEVLDKTGLNKEQKELVGQIEAILSTIARQGRAFGIHLILSTQRPDATIIPGQIRNNLDCRICGRADAVLSQIILDNSDAATMIPKDAQGRFIINNGTVFQSYWFDEKSLLESR